MAFPCFIERKEHVVEETLDGLVPPFVAPLIEIDVEHRLRKRSVQIFFFGLQFHAFPPKDSFTMPRSADLLLPTTILIGWQTLGERNVEHPGTFLHAVRFLGALSTANAHEW